jgi:beta-glucuronidase
MVGARQLLAEALTKMKLRLSISTAFFVALLTFPAYAQQAPIVITGADRRPAQSLNGDWHVIPDPYQTGLYDFHKHEIKNGWFVNEKAKPGDTGPMDYDFFEGGNDQGAG